VVSRYRLRCPPAVAQKGGAEPRPFEERFAGTEVPEHEERRRRSRREVDLAEIRLERHVVAEPLRLFVRVDVTAHPGEQRRVVDDCTVLLVQTNPLRQAQCDHALAEHMLHRLAHAQIRPERESGQQLHEADPAPLIGAFHDRRCSR
jgi:hypothetical protein